MQVLSLKCKFCKKDIILGQMAVEVILDDGITLLIHRRCLKDLEKDVQQRTTKSN